MTSLRLSRTTPALLMAWVVLGGCTDILGIKERHLRSEGAGGGQAVLGDAGGSVSPHGGAGQGGVPGVGGVPSVGGGPGAGSGGGSWKPDSGPGPGGRCRVSSLPQCETCLCGSCDPTLADACRVTDCGPLAACIATTGCSDPATCTTACPAFQNFAAPAALLDCFKQCGGCGGSAVCTSGKPCSTPMGKNGVCQGGACQPCTAPVNTQDPRCLTAYGGAQACCAADGACAGCPSSACGADNTPCTGASGVPGGAGVCLSGQCVQCAGPPGATDATCGSNAGGTMLCCSAAHTCVDCGCNAASEGKSCPLPGAGGGICVAGACTRCQNAGANDPRCNAAYGAAQACCSAAGSCIPCASSGCTTQAQCPAGYLCTGGTCSLCTKRGALDPACQSAFGVASGCCNSTGFCSACPVPCGNAALDPGESCDDGNAAAGDGCSSSCQVETGYLCDMGPGTLCHKILCVPKTCADLGATCGPIGDGCGGLTPCGTCVAPATCGGGGTPNRCGGGAGTCSPAGLLAYWNMEEGAGIRADQSVHGLYLEETNGVVGNAPGKFGIAAHFTATSMLTIPAARFNGSALDPTGNQLTIAGWMRFDTSVGGNLIAHTRHCVTGHYGLRVTRPPDVIGYGGIETTINPASYTTPAGIVSATGVWHHYAAVYDGTSLYLYLDGVPTGTTDAPAATIQNPLVGANMPLTVGGWIDVNGECSDTPGKSGVHGDIDDLVVFDRALPPAQITLLRDSGPCTL